MYKRQAEKVLNLTRRIVEEHQLTCLMITHNMQSAIELGNRILMMDSGNIVLDIGEMCIRDRVSLNLLAAM